jgi:anti-sigma-K factor RskA
MTSPDDDLLDLATPYALHAVTDDERADIERRVGAEPAASPVRNAFADEVRGVRETMAFVSAITAVEPPAHLRAGILAATDLPAPPVALETRRPRRWRTAALAAAAAILIGLSAFGLGVLMRPPPTQTMAEQIMGAPDLRTVSGPVGNGTATFVFSHDRNAGMLVMNNVPPPSPGTVYQMWLMGDNGTPTSAGTMGVADVAPTTKAVVPNLGTSRSLAFTVEPGKGSPQPTGAILAKLPLA